LINVMNVVTVPGDSAPNFEDAFSNRERLLDQADGFAGFELLRRALDDGRVEYLVISRWETEEAFNGWVRSDLFKKAHARDGQRNFGGHSEIRRYDVIDIEEAVA
jgi:heme-degrading monooxygenase HmoA